MQTLGVVDLFNEPGQPGGDISEGLVAADVDLLDLERLHEALALGIVNRLLAHSSIDPALKEKLTAQFKDLHPVRLLQEIRLAQQTLSDMAAHGISTEAAPSRTPDVGLFLKSLSSAWKDGEIRPTHRKQPTAEHWWRNRVDPFVNAWPVVEGWLIAEPTVSAKALMERMAATVPDAYASKAQLRTLQRQVKASRAERAKEMILGRLRKSTVMPAQV
jgi:hypothetical protein